MRTTKQLLISMIALLCCTGAWASSIPGALSGRFTINASGEKVLFSQGNLQYQASTDTWRFAENQYDYIGSANSSISESYTGWIDLFGWATNGLEANTATGKMPYYAGTTDEDYGPSITSGEFDKTIYDWGKAIDDSWHTLSNAEWNYIFAGRANYSSLYGFGRLFGVNGVFLLPDDWSWSETSIATAATAAGFAWSGGAKTFSSNIISNNTLWSVMESAGAVFIPAAGYRQGTTTNMSGDGGDYWSSTASSDKKAYRTSFYNEHLNLSNNYGRSDGISVRLVRSSLEQDAEGYYLLGSADDWKDFAAIVNSGTNPAANAKMTADINLGDDQTKIGSYATRYSGIFDGQGHTLTLNYNTSSMSIETGQSFLGAAPFRDIEGATIRNVHTAGSIIADKIGASGLVGWAYGTNTIENCWSDVNIASSNNTADTFTGFVAFMYGTSINITDCIFTGCIQSTCKKSHSGFIGYHYSGTSALTNCLVILDEGSDTNIYSSWLTTFFTFDRFAKEDQSAGTYTNCYYYRDFGVAQGTKATAAELADGTIAYKLQNLRGDLVWGQRIGTDTEPVLTNDENYRVYRSKNGGYTNNPEEAYEGIQQDGEGNYLLGCLSDWQDFAEIVNSGTNTAANAKMTADINLGDYQTMIGSYHQRYQGTFNGQGHTLTVNYNTSGMSCETEQRDLDHDFLGAGPFKDIQGATIRNLHTAGIITADKIGAAGLVGWTYGTNTIEQCWSDVDIVSSNNTADTFAGFVAFQYGTQLSITDCVYTGKIQSESKISHGGFVAFQKVGVTNLNNCLLILDEGSDVNTTASAGYMFHTFVRNYDKHNVINTINNCYYLTPFGVEQGTQATVAELADGTTSTALQNGRAEEIWVQDPLTNQPMLKLFATNAYKVPSSGIGTFSAKAKFALPDGLNAYYCKNYDEKNTTIAAFAIEGVVPANTGVILKGEPGETYTLTGTNSEAATVTGNALVAVTEETFITQTVDIDAVNYTNFGLSGGVFKKVNSKGGTVKANRAYLQIPSIALSSAAEGIMLVWDEETDGISCLSTNLSPSREVIYYDLQGRRVAKPAKGLYIVNGKKVIIK